MDTAFTCKRLSRLEFTKVTCSTSTGS